MSDVRKVFSGQSVRFNANEQNRIADVANRNGMTVPFTGAEFSPGTYIRVKMEDSYPRNPGEALRVYEIINLGNRNNVRHPCATARLPAENSQPVILVEPYDGRRLALALVSGVTECPVNITSIYHDYARCVENDTTLQSSVHGPVRLLTENAAGTRTLGLQRCLVQLSNAYDISAFNLAHYDNAPELSIDVDGPTFAGVPTSYQEFTLTQSETPKYSLSHSVRILNKVSYLVDQSPSGTGYPGGWYCVSQYVEVYSSLTNTWSEIPGSLQYGATQRYRPDEPAFAKETLGLEFMLSNSGTEPKFRVATTLIRYNVVGDPLNTGSGFLPFAKLVSCCALFTTALHTLYPFADVVNGGCPGEMDSDDTVDTTPVDYDTPGDYEYTLTTESVFAEAWGPGADGGGGSGPTAGGSGGRYASTTITGLSIGGTIPLSVASGGSVDLSLVIDASTCSAGVSSATGDTTHIGGTGGAAGATKGGGGGAGASPAGNGANGQSGAAGGLGGAGVTDGGAGGNGNQLGLGSPGGFPGGGGGGKGTILGGAASLGGGGKVRITPIA